MRFFACLLVLTIGLTGSLAMSPAPAVAQDDPDTVQQVEALSIQAADHFQNEDYEKAIELFEEAYELEPVPNLLYNIARCYEQLEEWEKAEKNYDQFVRSPDVDSDARDHAMDRISELRDLQEMQQKEEERQREKELAEQQAKEEEKDEKDEAEQVEELDAPSMMPAYASIGGGAVLLAGGTILGLMANSNADTVTDTSASYDERLEAQSSARTQGVMADAFLLSGLAATAVGTYLFFSARSDTPDLDDAETRTIVPFGDGQTTGVGILFDF